MKDSMKKSKNMKATEQQMKCPRCEEMSEELRMEFSRFFVDPQNTVKQRPKTRPRLVKKIAARLGISDRKEVA